MLFRDEPVLRPVRTPVKPVREKSAASPENAQELYEILRALRVQIAEERKVPAYMIFSNATLQDMAAKAPTTAEEFRCVSGVGKVKANAFGERFCAAVCEYLSQQEDTVLF